MTRGGRVECDACKTGFTPVPVERPTRDGGVRIEFACPSCGAVYPVAAITASGVYLRSQLSRLANAGQANMPQYRSLLARYQRQVRRLASRS